CRGSSGESRFSLISMVWCASHAAQPALPMCSNTRLPSSPGQGTKSSPSLSRCWYWQKTVLAMARSMWRRCGHCRWLAWKRSWLRAGSPCDHCRSGFSRDGYRGGAVSRCRSRLKPLLQLRGGGAVGRQLGFDPGAERRRDPEACQVGGRDPAQSVVLAHRRAQAHVAPFQRLQGEAVMGEGVRDLVERFRGVVVAIGVAFEPG